MSPYLKNVTILIFNCAALPSNWTSQPNDDNGKPKVCAYIEVAEGTTEYDQATHRFKQTLGSCKVTIVKVQRVQNPGEYMRYEALKASWRQTTEGNVKEETVFHGTKRANIEPISKTGFNRIFAAEANGKVSCYNFLCLITAILFVFH